MLDKFLFTPQHLADFVQGELVLKKNFSEKTIESIASITNAQAHQLTFLSEKKFLSDLKQTTAGLVILKKEFLKDCPVNAIVVDNPSLSFTKLSHQFKKQTSKPQGIHPSCVIAKSAKIATTAKIAAFCYIGENVIIEDDVIIQSHCVIEDDVFLAKNSYLHPKVTLAQGVIIKKNFIGHSGCVIGSDGFANTPDIHRKWHKIAQLGSVSIGENVEIGANTTIDRGAINNTIIADGVRIDNLVHIAHNVQIGEDCAITACVAIAGSTKLGKRVMIGGNAAIADHINIADDVIITGLTAIDRDIEQSGVWTGFMPAVPHKEWLRLSMIWRKKIAKITRFFQKQFKKD